MSNTTTIRFTKETKRRFDIALLVEAAERKEKLTADAFLKILLDIQDSFKEGIKKE